MSASARSRRLQSPAADPGQARIAAVAPVAALVVVVSWAIDETWWAETGLIATLLVCVAAALVDVSDGRIPHRLVVASMLPTLVVLAAHIGSGDGTAAVTSLLLGIALFAGPLLVAHLIAPAALGFGDVKLAVSLGAALGMVEWRSAIAALCIASGVTAAVAIVRRRPEMPLAPGLVAGTALVVLLPTLEGSVPWR